MGVEIDDGEFGKKTSSESEGGNKAELSSRLKLVRSGEWSHSKEGDEGSESLG